jgi:hypothetical protein
MRGRFVAGLEESGCNPQFGMGQTGIAPNPYPSFQRRCPEELAKPRRQIFIAGAHGRHARTSPADLVRRNDSDWREDRKKARHDRANRQMPSGDFSVSPRHGVERHIVAGNVAVLISMQRGYRCDLHLLGLGQRQGEIRWAGCMGPCVRLCPVGCFLPDACFCRRRRLHLHEGARQRGRL